MWSNGCDDGLRKIKCLFIDAVLSLLMMSSSIVVLHWSKEYCLVSIEDDVSDNRETSEEAPLFGPKQNSLENSAQIITPEHAQCFMSISFYLILRVFIVI